MTSTGAYGQWDVVEDRYVDEVRRALHDVPHRQRKALVAVVRTDLAERPAAGSWDELVAEVGPPEVCASMIRAEHDLPAHVGWWPHVRAVRWTTWLILGVVVLGAVGGGAYQWWTTADAAVVNFCSGAGAPDGEVTDHGVAVEEREAAGAYETVLTYRDGAEVELSLCIGADPGVEVVDVQIAQPSLGIFQLDEVTASSSGDLDVNPPLRDPMPVPRNGLRVSLRGHLANCEYYDPGGGMSLDTADVIYRYRGRTRTVPVDLHTQYTFLVRDRADCPRTRPDG